MKQLSLIALLALFSAPAMAYVGPGLGMGVIGTIFGVLAAIVLALFGLFWYPLKRALNKRKTAIDVNQTTLAAAASEQENHLDTAPSLHEGSSGKPSKNVASNYPGALNGKSEPASAERTDSQVQ